MITLEERLQIKSELPSGSIVKLAEMAGVAPAAISSWFVGRTNSKHIEDCVFMLIIEERKDSEKKRKMIGMA